MATTRFTVLTIHSTESNGAAEWDAKISVALDIYDDSDDVQIKVEHSFENTEGKKSNDEIEFAISAEQALLFANFILSSAKSK
jgi:hypothetical protein